MSKRWQDEFFEAIQEFETPREQAAYALGFSSALVREMRDQLAARGVDQSMALMIPQAFAELAEAMLRMNYSKDLHNIEMLEALATLDSGRFLALYAQKLG